MAVKSCCIYIIMSIARSWVVLSIKKLIVNNERAIFTILVSSVAPIYWFNGTVPILATSRLIKSKPMLISAALCSIMMWGRLY